MKKIIFLAEIVFDFNHIFEQFTFKAFDAGAVLFIFINSDKVVTLEYTFFKIWDKNWSKRVCIFASFLWLLDPDPEKPIQRRSGSGTLLIG